MRTIYIDSDYKCHIADDGTMTPVATDSFDGCCDDYIEGCRRWVSDIKLLGNKKLVKKFKGIVNEYKNL